MQANALVIREDSAAEALGVSPRTLQRWRVEGRGPAFIKIGPKAVGYTEADLREFVAAGRHQPGVERAGK